MATALAQDGTGTTASDAFSGKYEGVARSEGASDLRVVFELKNNGGKISGRAIHGQTSVDISEGALVDGKLTLKLVGNEGALTAKVDGEKITGEWVSGVQKRSVELKKVVAATAVAAAPTGNAFNLAGEWEAVADAQGQAVPFVLVLKVEGEKVTGSSSSQMGDSTISNGVWKDGQLSFQLEGATGSIAMTATVVEGKLTGEFDFAGQLQGRWVAVKKK
jgi:hypothetical protein